MKFKTKKIAIPAAVGLVGGAAGYLIYRFIGCSAGACPITSSPYLSVLFGALIGALLGTGFAEPKRGEEEENG
jgi:hypothetical protein